jgi:hypothetical protein
MTTDFRGNVHRAAGTPGAGEFTGRTNIRPAGTIAEVSIPPFAPAYPTHPAATVDGTARAEGDGENQVCSCGNDTRSGGWAATDQHGRLDFSCAGFVESGEFDVCIACGRVFRNEDLWSADETPAPAVARYDTASADFQLALDDFHHDASGSTVAVDLDAHLQRTPTEAQIVASVIAEHAPHPKLATMNAQSYPYLFDGNNRRIMIDDQTAECSGSVAREVDHRRIHPLSTAHVESMTTPYLSITEDQLGHDPAPYYDPATGERMDRARYSPVNVYAPRPEYTRRTQLPLSAAMATFRLVWSDQVHGGLDHPELVAHQLAATSDPAVWGEDATAEQIEHARAVAGKFARALSGGALMSL